MDGYEWDDAKNEANKLKHGIGFEAIEGFDWSSAITLVDDRFDYGEIRRLAYGRIGSMDCAVVFVVRRERVRVISLRRVHAKEMKRHERD